MYDNNTPYLPQNNSPYVTAGAPTPTPPHIEMANKMANELIAFEFSEIAEAFSVIKAQLMKFLGESGERADKRLAAAKHAYTTIAGK